MRYPGIIFDLDGTLLDTLEDIAYAANAALASVGLPPRTAESFRKLVGRGGRWLIEQIVDVDDPAVVDEASRVLRETYAAHADVHTRPYVGVPVMLSQLVERGARLAVLSNKTDAMVRSTLERYFPDVPFEAVQGLSDAMPPKPDPAMAHSVLRALSLGPDSCVLVGDTEIDLLTAERAALAFLGVAWGFRDAAELRLAGAEEVLGGVDEILHWWDSVGS